MALFGLDFLGRGSLTREKAVESLIFFLKAFELFACISDLFRGGGLESLHKLNHLLGDIGLHENEDEDEDRHHIGEGVHQGVEIDPFIRVVHASSCHRLPFFSPKE